MVMCWERCGFVALWGSKVGCAVWCNIPVWLLGLKVEDSTDNILKQRKESKI